MSNEVQNIGVSDFSRLCNSMPVLEDGLSSGHESETEINSPNISNLVHHHDEKDYIGFSLHVQQNSINNSYENEKNDQQQAHDNISSDSTDEREHMRSKYGYTNSSTGAYYLSKRTNLFYNNIRL